MFKSSTGRSCSRQIVLTNEISQLVFKETCSRLGPMFVYKKIFDIIFLEKKEEIGLSSMTKAPTPTEKSKKQRDGNIKTPPKTSITQRLQTDLWRSVGVTIATQLVWLNQLTGPNLPTHHNSCVIEGTDMQVLFYS